MTLKLGCRVSSKDKRVKAIKIEGSGNSECLNTQVKET